MDRADAELAIGWAAGERDAFAEVYRRYADALYGTCVGLLGGDRAAAADVVQDTFVRAATRIGQLRDPSRLRAWLFAIARNEVTNRHRAATRLDLDEDLSTMASDDADPTTALTRAELIELVWVAAGSLQERDREVLELHLRGGLDGRDLAEALGLAPSHAYVLVSRMKDRMERALGSLLIARAGRRDCAELAKLLGGWDGRFTLDVRSKVTRHVEGCDECTRRRKALVAFDQMVLGAFPLIAAPGWLADRVAHAVVRAGAAPAGDGWRWRDDGFPEPPSAHGAGARRGPSRRRRRRLPTALAVVLASLGLVTTGVALMHRDDPEVEVADAAASPTTTVASAPTPTSTGTTPSSTTPLTTSSAVPATVAAGATEPTETTAPLPAGPAAPVAETTSVPPTSPMVTDSSPTLVSPSVVPTTAAAAPGRLVLDRASLDLGPTAGTGQVRLQNGGGQTLSWSTAIDNGAFGVAPSVGSLAPGQAVVLAVSVSRSGQPEGDMAATLQVAGGTSGSGEVVVHASVEIPPVITRVAITPPSLRTPGGSSCTPTTAGIKVAASDDSGISAAEARWSPATTGTVVTSLTPASGGYAGGIGPFLVAGDHLVTVVVTDTRGNRASRTTTVRVVACP